MSNPLVSFRLISKHLIKDPKLYIQHQKSFVFGKIFEQGEQRSCVKVIEKPLKGDLIQSHWSINEIWDWPKASGLEWVDYKKQSIQNKLLSLAKRGKGPLAKKDKQASSSGKKKRR